MQGELEGRWYCSIQLDCENYNNDHRYLQCESKNPPPCGFLTFSQMVGIFNQFFTHQLQDPFYTRWQIYIQLFPTLMKLCHTKHDHPANFYISLELYLLSLLTEQVTLLLTPCHIQHVYWHYKSVCYIVTFHGYNDLCKRLSACVLADGGHFEHIMWTG